MLPPPTMRGWRSSWRGSARSTLVVLAEGPGTQPDCWFLLSTQSLSPRRPPLRGKDPTPRPLTTTRPAPWTKWQRQARSRHSSRWSSSRPRLDRQGPQRARARPPPKRSPWSSFRPIRLRRPPRPPPRRRSPPPGEPSVDLFEVAAQEFVEALRPEARPATPRVFMEDLSKIGAPLLWRRPPPRPMP